MCHGWNSVFVSLKSWPGQLLSLYPCWRAKILAEMLFWDILSLASSEMVIIQSIYSQIVIVGESKPNKIPGHSWLSFLHRLCLILSLLYRTFSHRYTHFVAFCRDTRLRTFVLSISPQIYA